MSGAAPRGILLTGATGFLGRVVLSELQKQTASPVFALVRENGDDSADRRLAAVLQSVGGDRLDNRPTSVSGDICATNLGIAPEAMDALVRQVDTVVHLAATVSFAVPLEEARRINVTGTANAVAFARRCARDGKRCRMIHVSTAYVAGTHRSLFHEGELDVGQGFRNPYERTKLEAEILVRAEAARAAIQLDVVRPSIVVGDHTSGWTSSFNVIYEPLRAYARGHLRALPAQGRAMIDVVPVDYVAGAIAALAGRPDVPGDTYHLVAGSQATSVEEIVQMAVDYFRQPRPMLLPPALYARVHPLLTRMATEPRRRALQRMGAFFPYMKPGARFDDARSRSAFGSLGLVAPPLPTYFNQLMDFALAVDWGRRPITPLPDCTVESAGEESASAFPR